MVKIIGNVKTRTVPCNHCHALLSYEVSDIQKKIHWSDVCIRYSSRHYHDGLHHMPAV